MEIGLMKDDFGILPGENMDISKHNETARNKCLSSKLEDRKSPGFLFVRLNGPFAFGFRGVLALVAFHACDYR
jgi:hypothetical protein